MSDPTELNQGGPPQVPGWKPPPDLLGTVLADRYKVISTLGDGGMGSVYLGEHVTLRKKVAIKVLKQEFCHDRTNVERFLQEARAASMIRHENIVDIMDFGQVPGGSVFFVMELLEGSDLSDMLKKVTRLPWLRTRNILLQVVRALRAAHESGIIHRDMKPGNVFLIARSSARDYVKVLDFGIAKVDDQNTGLTRTGAVFGTAGYMAPEQACGDPVDGRTDVYAVGCMMFEMLTGRTPFTGTNFMRVLTQHMNEAPPRPCEVNPDADVSDEVETIILTALSKKPEDRFPDMAAFEKAIAQANGEVATVPPQNRPRTDKGTLVLEDDGMMSPFAGMTPGVPPPGYGGPESYGEPNADATMMLDMGDSLGGGGGGGGGDATMMLDGMGGYSIGNDDGGNATMMLDGLPDELGNAATITSGDTSDNREDSVVRPTPRKDDSRKKLMVVLGVVIGILVLVIVLGLVFRGGGDDDDDKEVAAADSADKPEVKAPADTGGEPDDTAGAAADSSAPPEVLEPEIPEPNPVPEPEIPEPNPVPEPEPETWEEVPEVGPTKKPPTGGTGTIKDALSDGDVSKSLKKIQKKISACKSKGGLPGMKINVNFLISDGKVKSASARPPHTSSPVGQCVAGVVKGARFPKAKQSKIVDHTFAL